MRVELTGGQLGVLLDCTGPKHHHWLKEAQLLPERMNTYTVVLPAIAWLQAMAALLDFTTGPRGGNRKGVSEAALNARQKIADAFAQYANHPALFGTALPRTHLEVIPCWKVPGVSPPARLFDIIPIKGHEFLHLVPRHHKDWTYWYPEMVTGWNCWGPLKEEAHWEFVRVAEPTAQASAG